MKLVKCTSCKGRHQNHPLTIGKIYEVIKLKNQEFFGDGILYSSLYLIIDETGLENWYKSVMFKELSTQESRDYKLNKIL